jgi:hypothetical protein
LEIDIEGFAGHESVAGRDAASDVRLTIRDVMMALESAALMTMTMASRLAM